MAQHRCRPGGKLRAAIFAALKAMAALATMAALPVTAAIHETALELVHGKPFVSVEINGKGPFRFVVDTGTGGAAFISPRLAAQLGLSPAGKITLNDPSGHGGQKVPVVVLETLTLAGVDFADVKAAVHELGNGDGECEGLLGFALFRDYLLTLDFPNRRMTLDLGDLAADGQQSVLPFRMPDGIPIVALMIGGVKIDAQLDSGGAGLSLPLQLASRLKFLSRRANLSNAHSLSTQFTVVGATLNADVHLGGYTFRRPFVEINPAFPLANFGSCPMQRFSFTFDQKNGLVSINSVQQTHRLAATPVPMRLRNAPERQAADSTLVPLG